MPSLGAAHGHRPVGVPAVLVQALGKSRPLERYQAGGCIIWALSPSGHQFFDLGSCCCNGFGTVDGDPLGGLPLVSV